MKQQKRNMRGESLKQSLDKGLKIYQPDCPGCNRKMYRAEQVFGISMSVEREEHGTILKPYLICRKCVSALAAGVITTRIERRIDKYLARYLFPISFAGCEIGGPTVCNIGGTVPWIAADREWFKQHPNRTHRLRRSFEEEIQAGGPEMAPFGWILVRQIEPGKRIRVGCNPVEALSESEIHNLMEDDQRLWQIFDDICGGPEQTATGGAA